MATKPTYTKMKLETLVDKSGNLKDGGKRAENFLDHFYDQKKFLTDVGLVDVFTAYLTYDGSEYSFDSDTRDVKKQRITTTYYRFSFRRRLIQLTSQAEFSLVSSDKIQTASRSKTPL